MPNINEYGDLTPRQAAYSAAGLLERGQYLLTTERFGQAKPLPKRHSKVIKFRRYHSFEAATAPLSEGIPPEGQNLSYTDYSAVLEQYGDVAWITDVLVDTHEDPIPEETKEIMVEQIGETIETIRIDRLKGGTNVYYANNASGRTTVASPPTRGDFRRITRAFHRNKARTISQIVKASAKISTEPVAPAFFAMGHTDLDSDIRSMSGFVPVEKYANSDKGLPGEIGKVENVRFILTPLFTPWENGATSVSSTSYLVNGAIPSSAGYPDVYPIIIVAKNAYGIVPLQGENAVTPAAKNPGEISVANPLGQKGFVSWKTYQAAVILNESWIARLEVLCTANPT